MSRLSRAASFAAFALCGGLSALPASAGYLSINGLSVEATGSETFHVDYAGSSVAVEFWCAAGDYVISKLHLTPTTRIYRSSRVTWSARDGVSFSLSAADSVGKSGMLVWKDDGSLSAAMAQEMCQVAKISGR